MKKMFPTVRYRAIEYEFEAFLKRKLTMKLLVLPVPLYGDLYPHMGRLMDVAFREPWTRAKMNCSFKLVNKGSVVDDFSAIGHAVKFQENFCPAQMRGERAKAVLTSSLTSQTITDKDQGYCFLEDHCRFDTTEMLDQRQHKTLYLKEEVLFVDHLPRFRKLPQLSDLLRRLKILRVPDPLLTTTCKTFSELSILRSHFSWNSSPTTLPHSAGADVNETFFKESTLSHESLRLPIILEVPSQNQHNFPRYCIHLDMFALVSEDVRDELTCLDDLRTYLPGVNQLWVEMLQCDTLHGQSRSTVTDRESVIVSPPAQFRLLPHMELDAPLIPGPHYCLHQCCTNCMQLLRELPLPPADVVAGSDLLSDFGIATADALWMAEKHHSAILNFLLAEPQGCDPVRVYCPLLEGSKEMGIMLRCSIQHHSGQGTGSLLCLEDPLGPVQCLVVTHTESTEMMEAAIPVHAEFEHPSSEDFSVFSFTQIDYILSEPSYSECALEPQRIVEDITVHKDDTDPRGTLGSLAWPGGQHITFLPRTCETQTSIVSESEKEQTTSLSINYETQPSLLDGFCGHSTSSPLKACTTRTSRSSQGWRPPNDLDPLHTFMMLRSQHWSAVPSLLDTQTEVSRKKLFPRTQLISECSNSEVRETRQGSCSEKLLQDNDKDKSLVINVEATESQWLAYEELQALASLCWTPINSLALEPLAHFDSLSTCHTRFLLEQKEKELSTTLRQGELKEKSDLLYEQLAFTHVLVTARDLLLTCDLSAAVEYVEKAKVMDTGVCLDVLWTRLRMVQDLSGLNQEPSVKAVKLEQQMKAWMLRNRSRTPQPKVLVIITMNSVRDTVKASLHRITGAPVVDAHPEKGRSKLDGRTVSIIVQKSWCVVVNSQCIGPDFAWHHFSLVVDYDSVEPSPWMVLCSESSIGYISFHTIIPNPKKGETDFAEGKRIPFVLLAMGNLLNHGLLQQALNSMYNMTVLERKLHPSLESMTGAQGVALITVDESTVIVTQELEVLRVNGASESVAQKLTFLSMQYSCCWVLLYCAEVHTSGTNVFKNLPFIYSALEVFGQTSENMDVKVLFASDLADMARCVYHIALHSLMTSGRDPVQWLARDWLSVLPSQEEEWLMSFPSISPLVAQLMLYRAPSLQWLQKASLPQLRELLPEVPYKVIKLFCNSTSLCQSLPLPAREPQTSRPLGWKGLHHSLDTSHGIESLSNRTSYLDNRSSDNDISFNLEDDPIGYKQVFRDSQFMVSWRIQEAEKPWMESCKPPKENCRSFKGLQSPAGECFFQATPWVASAHVSPLLSASFADLSVPSSTDFNPAHHFGNLDASAHVKRDTLFRRELERKRCFGEMKEDREVSQVKKRRLTYERVPGRGDGQTRLMLS